MRLALMTSVLIPKVKTLDWREVKAVKNCIFWIIMNYCDQNQELLQSPVHVFALNEIHFQPTGSEEYEERIYDSFDMNIH